MKFQGKANITDESKRETEMRIDRNQLIQNKVRKE